MNIYKMGILVGLFSILSTQVAVAADFVTGIAQQHAKKWLLEKSVGMVVAAGKNGFSRLAGIESDALAGTSQGSSSTVQQLLSYTTHAFSFFQWLGTTGAELPIVGAINKSPAFARVLEYGPAIVAALRSN